MRNRVLRFLTGWMLGATTSPNYNRGTESTLGTMPKRIQCFSVERGVLIGLWPKACAPPRAYYDAETALKHPDVPGCPQLILAGEPSVEVALDIIHRPTEEEVEGYELDGAAQVVMRHNPKRPELKGVCITLVEKIERQHRAAQRASRRAHTSQKASRIRVKASANARRPVAHSQSEAAATTKVPALA